jgi:ParB/RepB/Spo0J family partition protein
MSRLKIDKIIVDDRMRKEDNFGDLESLAASINKFGLLHPIVVTKDRHLIAGERRLRACKLLGWAEIPVSIFEDLDDLQRKEIELEENIQRQQMTWVEECQAKKDIHEIKVARYGGAIKGHESEGWKLSDTAQALGKSIGSVSQDIKLAEYLQMFPELGKEKNKSQAYKKIREIEERAILKEIAKRQAESGVQVADTYKGDCREIMKGMIAESVDLVILDPPWGIEMDDESYMARNRTVEYDDSWEWAETLMRTTFQESFRLLREDRHAYVYFGISKYNQVLGLLLEAGFEVNPIPIAWSKGQGGRPGTGMTYTNSYESIFHCWKGRRQLNGTPINVLSFARPSDKDRIHSAQKSIELCKLLIEQSTLPGETVLEPFAGSGMATKAARLLRRKGIAIELDDANYVKMCQNLADLEE